MTTGTVAVSKHQAPGQRPLTSLRLDFTCDAAGKLFYSVPRITGALESISVEPGNDAGRPLPGFSVQLLTPDKADILAGQFAEVPNGAKSVAAVGTDLPAVNLNSSLGLRVANAGPGASGVVTICVRRLHAHHAVCLSRGLPAPSPLDDAAKHAFLAELSDIAETAKTDPAFAAALREIFGELELGR